MRSNKTINRYYYKTTSAEFTIHARGVPTKITETAPSYLPRSEVTAMYLNREEDNSKGKILLRIATLCEEHPDSFKVFHF